MVNSIDATKASIKNFSTSDGKDTLKAVLGEVRMKRAARFTLSPTWKVLLKDMAIDASEVLIRAELPEDLFSRENATLTPAQYFALWHGIEQCAGNESVPLLLAEHLSVESFDAPLFAAICSKNLTAAVKRIQQYKPLIGPMELKIG